MLYTFKLWANTAEQERNLRERGLYVDICSQTILDRGHAKACVCYNLAKRLLKHLERKGHRVIWL